METSSYDKKGFAVACESVMYSAREQKQIGTLGEKTLHAVVKHYIEPDDSKHEIRIGPFFADIVTDSGIIEVQTRSFNNLRKKLKEFLELAPVTVVYPLPGTKWLLWIDGQTGEVTKKRKSPKRYSVYDAIGELYKIRPLLSHPNMRLRIIFIDIEEYRYLDGWSKDRKKGSTRCDRIPKDIVGDVCFCSPADYIRFIPDDLRSRFTSKDLKIAAKINLHTAQTVLNILHHIGTVRRVDKQGNLYVYERQ